MAIVWASASTWMTPGMTGRPGKWPWKNHSVAVTALIPTIRFSAGSYSTMRSTSRNGQRCGIRPSISLTESGAAMEGYPSGSSETASAIGVASVTGGSMCDRGECAAGRTAPAWWSVQGGIAGTGRSRAELVARWPGRASTAASRALRPGEEGGAADPVQHVGRELAVQERLRGEQRLVDVDVGHHALDDELPERRAATGDGRLPGGRPHDELA